MRTMILLNGDMVVTIPKEEKDQQLQHLDSLIPADQAQYDEITVLFDLVKGSKSNCKLNCKPTLKLVKDDHVEHHTCKVCLLFT